MEKPENTVEQDNLVERERLKSELRDRARQFRELFTSPLGKSVFETLQGKFATVSGFPPNQLDNNGRTDALQTWRKLGHHDVLSYIKLQMEHTDEYPGSSST